jgi:hypothetical protein
MSRVPMPEAWVDPWSCTMVEKTLMRAPSIRLGSWSGTKQLKSLDKPRAPGKVQGTHAYGMGCFLVWDQAVKAPRYV